MVHLVTFSDESMSESAYRCALSSKLHGVGTHSRFSPGNIGTWQEVLEHPEIFRQPEDPRRCWGWWAWKPLVIRQEMGWLPDNSTLIYSDAGVEFINNVNYIIDRMGHEKPQDDVWLFGNNWEHAYWCKRDVVDAIIPPDYGKPVSGGWLDHELAWVPFGKQVQASVIFFRVSDYSRQFVSEWLKWCLFEGGRLIDDSPSRAPNHPQFQENRHDQSILTTMSYREGLKLHWWPAVYNRFVPGGPVFTYEKGEYRDDYPPLFHHHRLRDWEWPSSQSDPIPSQPIPSA